MRLGSWMCTLRKNTLSFSIYKAKNISERHRHRYELNNEYLEKLEQKGLIASGVNKETNLVEVIELENHPWFIGVQYHPEYQSTVSSPHPLFVSFVHAAKKIKNN